MKPASAPKTPKSAPNQLERGPVALVSLKLTESQAGKIGLGDQWRLGRNRTLLRRKRKQDGLSRLEMAVQELLRFASEKQISQRKMLKTLDLSVGTWTRCRQGKVNPRHWLPKLEAALSRLKAS